MNKEQRIKQLEQEIGQFDYQRMKKQELAREAQIKLQNDLADIHDGILTRHGEIICLQRMIEEDKKEEKKDESNIS